MRQESRWLTCAVAFLATGISGVASAQSLGADLSASAETDGAAGATAEGEAGGTDGSPLDGESETESDDMGLQTQAADSESLDPEETDAGPADSLGLNADLGIATIYYFRGLNVFQETGQMDQNAIIAPSLTWSIFDTGLYLGYWGGYQLTGNNQADLVRAGFGNEQDIFLGYDYGLLDELLTINARFTCYFFPFADEDVAGTGAPAYIEPLVGVTLSTVLDVGFSISYFHGIQPEPIIEDMRYVYFNLYASKGVSFNDRIGMDFAFSFGGKVWIENIDANRFDLLFSWSLPINITETLYLKPAAHFGWTDLDRVVALDDPTTPEVEFDREATGGDEYLVYGSVNIGANF